MALKAEAMGLAVMLGNSFDHYQYSTRRTFNRVANKNRTKDLLQAYYGRNGECPMPIVSASTPGDCFDAIYEAVRIAVQHMTPVIFLSDGYIANGAEPWSFPKSADLPPIEVKFKTELDEGEEKFPAISAR